MITPSLAVDATGLKCPMPILKCKKAISQLEAEQVLKISATDKGAEKDFAAFCQQTGHTLIDLQVSDGVYTFLIKKKAA